MKKPNWWFYSRPDRNRWLSERFKAEFAEATSVLDVGCGESGLKSSLHRNIKYTGIDLYGRGKQKINLDKISKLPFNKKEFDIVVCADVLEHLENIHLIFDELCRVSNKYIIITLPNPLTEFVNYFLKHQKRNSLKHGKYASYYGLPPEKPRDRHRWFFSYEEAVEFVSYRADKNKYHIQVLENDQQYKKLNLFKRIILIISNLIYKNILIGTTVFLLKRNKD